MKRLAVVLVFIMSAGFASAQQESRPSQLDQVRSEADTAFRRETDLTARIASQERANASLRAQLRKDPAGSQRDLVDASAEAAVIRSKVAAQKLRFDIASDNLADARAAAMRRLDRTDSMRVAQNNFQDAAAELDRLSQPIFEKLTQDPDYQQAQALAEAAAQAGEALQAFDATDPKAQAEADAAYDQAIGAVRALEDAAIDADSDAARAHQALQTAQKNLDDLNKANETRIAADPKVDAAKFAFDLEQRLLDESRADLAVAEKHLSGLRQAANPQGAPGDLADQLKAGEARLHEMSDQLDQVRTARRDADERLRYLEELAASNPDGGNDLPPIQMPREAYPPVYGDAPLAYGYPYYPVAPSYAYDPFYCAPYFSTGLYFGTTFYSHGHYYHHYRDSSWCSHYDHWRGHSSYAHAGGGHWDGHAGFVSHSGSLAVGRADLSRGSSRTMSDFARPAAVQRDYNGSHVNTYYYPNSTGWKRELESSSRSRFDSPRGSISITRSGGSRFSTEERRVDDAVSSRHSSASDSPRYSRVEVSPSHSSSSDSGSSHASDSGRSRVSDSSSHSSASDSGRSRGGDSVSHSSSSGDSGRGRGSAGSSIGSSSAGGGGGYRGSSGGGGGSPSYSAGSSRGSSSSSGGGSSRGSSGSSGGSSHGGGGGGGGRR